MDHASGKQKTLHVSPSGKIALFLANCARIFKKTKIVPSLICFCLWQTVSVCVRDRKNETERKRADADAKNKKSLKSMSKSEEQ